MSGTLNSADYQTVWNDNFTESASLDSSLFPIQWGDASEFSFGGNGLTLTSNGTAAGFLTPDQGAGNSYGYGLYSAAFTMPTSQAAGAYICLWPATNEWPGPEIDLTEQLNGQSYLTVHWQGSGDSNQYQSFYFNANTSQPTTVAVDWEANSLTFYVNGKEVVQYPSGGPVPVPKDYADGGENEAFGIGNVGPSGTALTVSDMSYSTSTGGGSSTSSTGAGSSTSSTGGGSSTSTSSGSTGTSPSTTIDLSSPGTVPETSAGAGVTVPITISDPGSSEVYAFVMNSNNVAEENWIPISLNSLGQATYDFHFENTGDYVLAVNNTTTQTDRGTSSPITITDPATAPSSTIEVSNPGTQHVANTNAGATVPITFSDPGLSEVYAFVMNSHNVAEENWIAIPLNSQGQATHDFHFEHTGDYVLAVSNINTEADKGWSAPITILHS